jgi:tetratricopeptide (TPR) repeat protein
VTVAPSDDRPEPPLEEESREFKKALLYIRSGDLDRARELLEEYCGSNPSSARAFNKLAFVYLEQGNAGAAEKVLSGLLSAGLKDFYTHFLYGRVLMRQGDVPGAVVHFTTALTINARDIYTLNALAEALVMQGEPEKALRCLTRAIEIAPSDPVSHISLGRFHLEAGRTNEARAAVRAGLAQAPDDPVLGFLEGRCLLAAGDPDAARARFTGLAQAHAGQAWGKLGAGLACEAAGDLAGAAREMVQATAIDAKNLEAHDRLAAVYSALGEPDKAVASMEKALALAPLDLGVQVRYARALYEKRLILKAWLRIQSVLGSDPACAAAHLLAAALYLDEDIPARADEAARKVLERAPDDPHALLLAAEARALMDRPDEAEELVARAAAQPGAAPGADARQAELVRALILRARGDTAGARQKLAALDDAKAAGRVTQRVRKLRGALA